MVKYEGPDPTLVIYHGPGCADGFTAAWAVWERYGNAPRYVACNYGGSPPDVTAENVVILDFSFPESVMLDMSRNASSLWVYDHHASAERALAPMLRDFYVGGEFDMARSGARIAWEAFHDEPAPLLVQYVEDHDLWLHALPDTKEINAALYSHAPCDFARWAALSLDMDDNGGYEFLKTEGTAIRRVQAAQVASLVKTARPIQICADIVNHTVPIVNCTHFLASDVGHALLTTFPSAPFAVTYTDDVTVRRYSLRSENARADVSKIAESFGGGGHRNAAGFELGLPFAPIRRSVEQADDTGVNDALRRARNP